MNEAPGPRTIVRKTIASKIHTQDIHTDARLLSKLKLRVVEPSIRSTNINDLHICPRLFALRHRMGLGKRRYDGARNVGSLYHSAVSMLLRGLPLEDLSSSMQCDLDLQRVTLSDLADKAGFLPGGLTLERAVDRAEKDHGMALALATWTWKHHPLDFSLWEVIAVEKLIEVALGDPEIKQPLRIRVDTLLRNKRTGHLWFEDRKTTGQDPLALSSTMLWDVQTRLYRLALAAFYPEEKIAGVIHSIVHVPQIRQRTARQPETWNEFLDRLIETCEERLDDWDRYYNSDPRHRTEPKHKIPYHYSEIEFLGPLMDEELAFMVREASQASRCRLHLGRFYRNRASCFKWDRPCEMLSLCSAPVAAWPSLIEQQYRISFRDEEDSHAP